MVAMIKAHPHLYIFFLYSLNQSIKFGYIAGSGFFHQYMFSSLYSREAGAYQCIIGCGYNHDIHILTLDGRKPVSCSITLGKVTRKCLCLFFINVCTNNEFCISQCFRAFMSDETTAKNGYPGD